MIGIEISLVLLFVMAGFWMIKRERWLSFQRFMLGVSSLRSESKGLKWVERLFPFTPVRSYTFLSILFLLPFIMGTVIGLFQRAWLPFVMGGMIALFAPWAGYTLRYKLWQRRCRIQMKEALRIASTAHRSGTTFAEALARAATELPQPMKDLLLQAGREIRLGKPEGEAFYKLVEQTGVREFSSVAGLIELAILKGGKLPQLLDDAVHYMEEDEELLADLRSETSSYRMSAYVLPLILLGLMSWFWPVIAPMLQHSWFLFVYIAALCSMSIGVILTFRLVQKLDV